MWKKVVVGLGAMVLLIAVAAGWLWSLIDTTLAETDFSATKAEHIAYLQQPLAKATQPDFKPRGKVLAVVTSTAFYPPAVVEGKTKKTGYELTELSRFYWVLQANGFAVDIASPRGGDAPRVLDDDDMAEFDYAFLNDATAMQKARNTIKLADVNAADYQAIYFVGGKGAMYDFPQNPDIARLVQAMTAKQKLVLAVCHGPAALAQLTNSDGTPWLQGKKVTSFTNAEELLLMPDAAKRFSFLLQSKLEQQGAIFTEGPRYLPNLVIDRQLITGQNPWSVWQLAEATVRALGVAPLPRLASAEERTMQLLLNYQQLGLAHAIRQVPVLLKEGPLQRNHVMMMAVVAAMAGEWSDLWSLLQLTSAIKTVQVKAPVRVTYGANLAAVAEISTDHATDVSANTQAQMATLLQQQQLTGVVWSTVTPDGISTGAAGIADSDQQTLLRPDHKVQVGSIAKTLMAVGILQLVSEGKLSLESQLSVVLPDIALNNPWAKEQPVLLRHLLDHTSGLDDARLWQVFSLQATAATPLRQAFPQSVELQIRSKPGSRLSYSNMGYTLLGMVIEQISGERYEQYLAKHLLQPLKMFDSSFGFVTQQGPAADPRLAMGHFENNVTQAAVPMLLRPAGQFTSTAADMALLARFLISDGVIHHAKSDGMNEAGNSKPLILPELLRAMGQPTTTESAHAGLAAGYALGLNNRDRHGVLGRCHVGTTFGFRANFCLFPQEKKAFFVAMNADVETAGYDQFDALLVQQMGVAGPEQTPSPVAALPEDISSWLGFYQLSPSRMESFGYLDLLLNFATLQWVEPQLHDQKLTSQQLTSQQLTSQQLQLLPFQGAARLLTPVGGHLFRANDRVAASHVLLMSTEQKRLISDGFRSYQQVSLWRLLPLWLSAIAGVIGLGFVLIAGIWRFFRTDSLGWLGHRAEPLLLPSIAVVALLLPLPLFFGQSFLQLGELTAASAALALVTGLLPLAMLLGIWRWLTQYRQSGSIAVNLRWSALLAMVAILQWCLVLIYWGLLPLRLWS